jgi:hypothetical protein
MDENRDIDSLIKVGKKGILGNEMRIEKLESQPFWNKIYIL